MFISGIALYILLLLALLGLMTLAVAMFVILEHQSHQAMTTNNIE
jgi:hypothetical protein